MHSGADAQLVEPPREGRTFAQVLRPGFADCAPSGRMRLDALARWLQDVAYADVEDAGVAQSAVWVVRRTRMFVARFPRFGERFRVQTFCSGLGRMWAERRTSITHVDECEPRVEAASLWVHLDPRDWRPVVLSDEELAVYGPAARGRRVTARLHHPSPPAPDRTSSWRFRATECDIAGHINNAAYFSPLEEELLAGDGDPDRIDVEIEYRGAAQPGEKLLVAEGDRRWIVGSDGESHASMLLARR